MLQTHLAVQVWMNENEYKFVLCIIGDIGAKIKHFYSKADALSLDHTPPPFPPVALVSIFSKRVGAWYVLWNICTTVYITSLIKH